MYLSMVSGWGLLAEPQTHSITGFGTRVVVIRASGNTNSGPEVTFRRVDSQRHLAGPHSKKTAAERLDQPVERYPNDCSSRSQNQADRKQ